MKCVGHLKGIPLFKFCGLSGNVSYSFKHTNLSPIYGKRFFWKDVTFVQYNNIIRNPKWTPVN